MTEQAKRVRSNKMLYSSIVQNSQKPNTMMISVLLVS